MAQMETWELLLMGALILVVLFWFRPGIKSAIRQSREAEHKDWAGALIPVALVVLFVILLIAIT